MNFNKQLLNDLVGGDLDIQEITHWFPTGSYYICEPPVEDTDRDYLCLIGEADLSKVKGELEATGWEDCGKVYENQHGRKLAAFRREENNLIFVFTPESFNKWWLATQVATELNLQQKSERILLFTAIIDGKFTNGNV